MKIYLFLSAFVIVSVLSGCKKELIVKTTNITNNQAAVMAATALSVNAYGLAAIKNDVTLYAKNLSGNVPGCSVLDSTAVAKQEPPLANINYNYALGYYYTVNCTGGIKDNLNSNVVYNGSFDAPALSVVNNGYLNINLAGLSGAAATYTITGSYTSSGSFQTLDNSQLTGNYNISITINTLSVNKTSRAITSGTADILISGTIKNSKNTFNYTGSIILNNATTATLALGGMTYTVNITTADVTAL